MKPAKTLVSPPDLESATETYATMNDVMALWGMKAVPRRGGTPLNGEILVWFPWLIDNDDASREWKNERSDDGEIIRETAKSGAPNEPEIPEQPLRLVFAKVRPSGGKYVFAGLFRYDAEASAKSSALRVWRRVSDRFPAISPVMASQK